MVICFSCESSTDWFLNKKESGVMTANHYQHYSGFSPALNTIPTLNISTSIRHGQLSCFPFLYRYLNGELLGEVAEQNDKSVVMEDEPMNF